MTTSSLVRQHLDAVAPLLETRLGIMEKTIALRRKGDTPGMLALLNSDEGKHSTDAIRGEMRTILQIEADLLSHNDYGFDESMRRLFAILVGVMTAGTTTSLPIHAKAGACALRATPGVWWRQRRT